MVSALRPSDCSCRGKPLSVLVSQWKLRTIPRVLAAFREGGVDMRKVSRESALLKDLADSNDRAFEGTNAKFGHLCETCPFRTQTPASVSLAVDRTKRRG